MFKTENGCPMIYPAVSAGIFTVDQLIKHKVEKTMQEGEQRKLAGGLLVFRSSRNEGAMLNAGQQHPALVRHLSLYMTGALAGVCVYSFTHKKDVLFNTALALLFGGACSNTLDRVCKKKVTDYVSFGVGSEAMRNVVFNIGDFGVIIGAVILAAAEMRE